MKGTARPITFITESITFITESITFITESIMFITVWIMFIIELIACWHNLVVRTEAAGET